MSSQSYFNSWSVICRILRFMCVIQLPSFFGNRVLLQVKLYPRPAPISAQKTMTCMTGSFILSEFKVKDVRTDLCCGTTHSEVSYLLMHTVAIPVVRESTMHTQSAHYFISLTATPWTHTHTHTEAVQVSSFKAFVVPSKMSEWQWSMEKEKQIRAACKKKSNKRKERKNVSAWVFSHTRKVYIDLNDRLDQRFHIISFSIRTMWVKRC